MERGGGGGEERKRNATSMLEVEIEIRLLNIYPAIRVLINDRERIFLERGRMRHTFYPGLH